MMATILLFCKKVLAIKLPTTTTATTTTTGNISSYNLSNLAGLDQSCFAVLFVFLECRKKFKGNFFADLCQKEKEYPPIGGRFNQHVYTKLLRAKIPKAQRDSQVSCVFFALLRFALKKASSKHVDEIDYRCHLVYWRANRNRFLLLRCLSFASPSPPCFIDFCINTFCGSFRQILT